MLRNVLEGFPVNGQKRPVLTLFLFFPSRILESILTSRVLGFACPIFPMDKSLKVGILFLAELGGRGDLGTIAAMSSIDPSIGGFILLVDRRDSDRPIEAAFWKIFFKKIRDIREKEEKRECGHQPIEVSRSFLVPSQ